MEFDKFNSEFDNRSDAERLGAELVKLLQPASLRDQEAAVSDGSSYGFRLAAGLNISTPRFIGCVAAQYDNDDGGRSSGYEQGTMTNLVVAGLVNGKLVCHQSGTSVSNSLDQQRLRTETTDVLAPVAIVEVIRIVTLSRNTEVEV